MTRRVKIINKREFGVAAQNADDMIFVVHVEALAELTNILIQLSYQAQVTALTSEETGIPAEYFDFSNVFSSDSAADLLGHPGINDHPTNLLNDKEPLYGLIYSLGLVELEMLKIYIKANLACGFIMPSKSPVGAP